MAGFYVVHYEMLSLKIIILEEWHFSQLSIYTDHKIVANP